MAAFRKRHLDFTKWHTLWKVKINQIQLMDIRGYIIPPEERFGPGGGILGNDYSYDDFLRIMADMPQPGETERTYFNRIYRHVDGHIAAVFYVSDPSDGKQLNKQALTVALAAAEVTAAHRTLLVIPKPLMSRDDIPRMHSAIEIIEERQLYTCPVTYELNQTMVRLTPSQKDDFLAQCQLTLENLPRMSTLDPNVVYHQWKEDDVIAILRYDPYTGGPEQHISYRAVRPPLPQPKPSGVKKK